MIQLIRNVFDMANGLPDTYDIIGSIRDSLAMLIVPRDIRDRPGATDILVTRGRGRLRRRHLRLRSQEADLRAPEPDHPGRPAGRPDRTFRRGKTTLVTLLMRLYDVQRGAVRIDGQNIAEVTQASLRRSIGLIPQDVVLFHRTLMENIRYGRPGASDAEVLRAAERAHAHEFIDRAARGLPRRWSASAA